MTNLHISEFYNPILCGRFFFSCWILCLEFIYQQNININFMAYFKVRIGFRFKNIKLIQSPKAVLLGLYLYNWVRYCIFTDFRILQHIFSLAANWLLESKISKTYSLQYLHLEASVSITKKDMTYLLNTEFYNMQFRWEFL